LLKFLIHVNLIIVNSIHQLVNLAISVLRYFTVLLLSFGYGASVTNAAGIGLQNPLEGGGITSMATFVEKFLKAVVYVGFPIAVLFVVYSGFLFVFAQGNSSDLEKAKKNFWWTIIGVGLFLGAWALATLIRGTVDQLR